MKLMKRDIPLENNWLSESLACVKCGSSWSHIFNITLGVRQGSVLSPLLFAVYIDDIGRLQNNRIGTFVVMYADNILFLAPSVIYGITKTFVGLRAGSGLDRLVIMRPSSSVCLSVRLSVRPSRYCYRASRRAT